MRTTSSLEGFNSQLNKKFPKNGNFFKFIQRLIEVEFVESRKMNQMADSGGSAQGRRENHSDVIIRNAMRDLNDGKITIVEFLNNVTCRGNKSVTDMAEYILPHGYISGSDSESESEDEVHNTPPAIEPHFEPVCDDLCIICADRKSNVLFMPCRHLKTCEECSSLLAAQHESELKCPLCKRLVANTIVVFN